MSEEGAVVEPARASLNWSARLTISLSSLRGAIGLAVAGFAVLVLSWPIPASVPPSLDLQWILGLHQAAADGRLHYGSDLAFTYGPIGFLAFPAPFVGLTSALAFAASMAVFFAFAVVLVHGARQHLPLVIGAAVALLLARTASSLLVFDALLFTAFAAGVWLLRQERVEHPILVAVAAGAIAAATLLGKLNVGVFVTAMAVVVVAAICRPRWKSVVALAISTAFGILALWIVTGQPLGDLLPYARTSLDIISGYSEAMGRTSAGLVWTYPVFAFFAAVGAWGAWKSSSGWPAARRLALGGLLALVVFATWKSGYVRFHVAAALVVIGLSALVLLPSTLARGIRGALVATFVIAYLGATQATPLAFAGVAASASQLAHEAGTAVAFWGWDAAAHRTQARLASEYPVPPEILTAMAGYSVDFDPNEAGLATAYPGLRWRPVPVFQLYQAYTPYLDDLNADSLRSPDRPQRILRKATGPAGGRKSAGSIDGRFYWFESPAASVERLCRYREVAASGEWQLLGDRGLAGGAPEPLGSATAGPGQSVAAPEAPSGDIVIVKVNGLGGGIRSRLQTVLWRSPTCSISLDGDRFRLVPGTAGQGLLLSVPPAAQGSPPFGFGAPVRNLSIGGCGAGPYDFRFFALSLPHE